jgi:glycerate kinase
MEARVARLEEGQREIRAILGRLEPAIARIDAQIPYLATKAEVEALRGDIQSKPGRGAMWGMGISLFCLTLAGLAAGAVWMPLMLRALHLSS